MRSVYVVLCVLVLFFFASASGIAAEASVADAAEKGDLAMVRSLIEQKADVNQAQADETTALHWAVRRDNLQVVDLLIDAGANVTAANRFGLTPMSLACLNGSADVIETLLKAGVDANASLSEFDETPLMLAARTGKPDAVKVLLDHGAKVNARESSKGQTALMWAAVEGNSSVVRMLIDHGADDNAASHYHLVSNRTFGRPSPPATADPATSDGQAFEVLKATEDPDDRLPLLLSFETEFPESKLLYRVFEDMLRIYEDRNDAASVEGVIARIRPLEKQLGRRPDGGMTALMFATREGHATTSRILVESGADLNATMGYGDTALLLAILNGHFELADYLLNHGADPNIADKDGKAPLYAAVEMRDYWFSDTPLPEVNKAAALTLIETLLEHGANPDAQITSKPPFRGGAYRGWLNEVGATAFYRAASSDDIDAMRLLLAHGADPTITAKDNTTPLMVAAGIGFVLDTAFVWPEDDAMEALRLCLKFNDVNATNDAGLTALHGAAFRGWNAAVQALVDHGAKLDALDKDGRTPLDWADGLYRGGGIAPVVNFETVALLKQLSQ